MGGGGGAHTPPTTPFPILGNCFVVERRIAVSRAIRDVETDQLLTGLRLLRSYFKKEQLQTPVLQFFKENLPNLSIVKNGKDGQYAVQWRDKEGNLSMNQAGRDMHKPLLHRISIAYPGCSTAMQSFGGIEFSRKAVKASLLGADNLQISDFVCSFVISVAAATFVLEELSDTQMLGLQDGLQTPGASSHGGLSVGMTPKTLRLPKHGEMLLSVHGSPLGVYKEDMEAIHDTKEEEEDNKEEEHEKEMKNLI
ncbi:hypothetical protein TEA_001485 [Camellia sinensis var. sinensis]|uniref:Uncharacterized protein n=1 Tax=Camellia sinensis var. sinensis TaxID=542762 RepID=A0A4S4E896_CAMSN|nr:hypothetical protein TEA_001485 [Camellia sinensis var. sinensis]